MSLSLAKSESEDDGNGRRVGAHLYEKLIEYYDIIAKQSTPRWFSGVDVSRSHNLTCWISRVRLHAFLSQLS